MAPTIFLLTMLCIGPHANAQDARDVSEPVIPPVCTQLTANLVAEPGGPSESAGSKLDTARIQDAINRCRTGMAVELRPDGARNAFLSGPLELKPGIALLVAGGAVLFGTRNPRAYDVRPGSCGLVDDDGRGCKPLIQVSHAPHAAVMGAGAIDGQGGQRLLQRWGPRRARFSAGSPASAGFALAGVLERVGVERRGPRRARFAAGSPASAGFALAGVLERVGVERDVTWWDLAHQAKIEDKKQNCPRLVVVDSSDDFTLYGITLRNSPNYHVIVSRTDGFTAWGVRIDSPATARNTDGIDPSSSTNVTIAYSWIRAGDDNIAIKAGKNGPASHMTILRNHFYSGHGMSIGSETSGGVSAIRVVDLTIDGADNGIRIKSDVSRGGRVEDIAYQDVCMRDVKNPILMDPFYNKTATGTLVPVYRDIRLKNVRTTGGGKLTFLGLDAQHLLEMQLNGVAADGVRTEDLRAAHARLIFGPGSVSLLPQGEDVQVEQSAAGEKGEAPQCSLRFIPFPDNGMSIPLQQSMPAAGIPLPQRMVTVAADGSGDYRSVQEGIDALSLQGGKVLIKPGIYREIVRVAKPNVRMEGLGDDPSKVVVVYGNSASMTGSTFTSATAFVSGDDFYAANLTFQNDFSRTHSLQPQGSQAVALSVTADRAVFRNVRFLGAQDTLYAASRSCRSESGPCVPTRQYFRDCYIEGHVDFIFGDSKAVFDHCIIHAVAHQDVMLTAQSKHYPEQESGYVFDHCKVTADPQVGRIFLGRPWRSYASVVFLESDLDKKVAPEGWREWHPGETERLKTAFYAEYQSTGAGAAAALREPYSRQLSEDEAAKYKAASFLAGVDGWDPSKR